MKLDFGNATLAGAWFTDQPTESPPVSSLASGVFLSASISNWRSLYTELCTALHLDTCLTFFAALLTCRLVVVYGRRLPANLMSARRVSIVTVGDRSFASVGPKLWNSLQQSTWWHYIGLIAVSFQKETENSLISSILSGRYFVVCYSFLSPSWSLKLIDT